MSRKPNRGEFKDGQDKAYALGKHRRFTRPPTFQRKDGTWQSLSALMDTHSEQVNEILLKKSTYEKMMRDSNGGRHHKAI